MSVHCSCVTIAPSGVEVGCALVVDAKAVMCVFPCLQSIHSSACRCVSCLSVQKILIVLLLFAFASSTAAAGAMSPGQSGYRDQRTWPAFKPRARPLFCLTSLGMFAVVLVDDVRYQEREGKNRDKAEGACEFLRLNSACDLCVCAAPNAKLSLFWPRSLECLSMQWSSQHGCDPDCHFCFLQTLTDGCFPSAYKC